MFVKLVAINKLSKYCPIFTEKSQKMAGKKNMPSAYHYVVIPVIEYILILSRNTKYKMAAGGDRLQKKILMKKRKN